MLNNNIDLQNDQNYWLHEQISKLSKDVEALQNSIDMKNQDVFTLMNELITISNILIDIKKSKTENHLIS